MMPLNLQQLSFIIDRDLGMGCLVEYLSGWLSPLKYRGLMIKQINGMQKGRWGCGDLVIAY